MPRDAAKGQRALGIEEIAVGPARFEPSALPGAIAELAGDGARRRWLELHVDIDDPAVIARDDGDVGIGDQRGGDQRAAQIVDPRAAEAVALAEAGDDPDMARVERRLAADPDQRRTGRPARAYRQDQGREMGLVIDDDVLLADFRRGEALLPERAVERDAGGDDLLGDDRVAFLDREGVAELLESSGPAASRPGSSTEAKRYWAAGIGLERSPGARSLEPSIRGSTMAS